MSRKKKTHTHDIHEEVMKQIHDEHIEMKPRVYFVVGSALLGAGMAGTVLVAIFFTNVTLYRLRYNNLYEYLFFGGDAYWLFLQSFPWIPAGVAVLGILGGTKLLRRYEYCYKRDIAYILIALTAAVVTTGYLIDQLGANKHINHMKMMEPIYKGFSPEYDYIRGRVVGVNDERAVIATQTGRTVVISTKSYNSDGKTLLLPGVSVKIIGKWQDDIFHVHRIKLQ